MNGTCNDQLLLFVRDNAVKRYNEIAPYLELSEQEEYAIRDDDSSSQIRKLAVLRKWRSKNGSAATCRRLAEAFVKMKDHVTAELIVSHVKNYHFTFLHKQLSPAPSRPDDVIPGKALIWTPGIRTSDALAQFPIWADMELEEREKIIADLYSRSEKIQAIYSHYLTCITKHLSSSFSLDVTVVKRALASKVRHNHIAFPELKSAISLSDVFFVLATFTSWFNYRLLQHLVNVLGHESGQKYLADYEDKHLKPYLERSIFLIPRNSLSPYASSSYVPCVMMVDDLSDLSGIEMQFVTKKLASLLEMPSLELMSYNAGSIQLVFGIHKEIFEDIKQEGSLLRMYIQWSEEKSSYMFTIDMFTLL